ncbi:GNAT family N-acetyltransferase [Clostridium sporogenes]
MDKDKKYYVKNYEIIQIKSINETSRIIYEFDKVFEPSLSERISDLNAYAEKLYKKAVIFAVTEQDNFIGFVAFYVNKNDKISYLTQIGVKENLQNKNIGKTLLELCIKISRDNGITSIKLEVFNNNIKAIEFYKKYGFDFYGEASLNSVYMIRKLK